jgi:glycerol-3-phosphate acyltransferase PlsY
LGDIVKGLFPVLLAHYYGIGPWGVSWVGFASFLGHLYPVFLKFKGGKGVATASGILLGVVPIGTVVLAGIFALVAITSRAVSLASLVAAGLAPLVLWLLAYPAPYVGLAFVLALLIVLRHRENIQRLVAGVEPKFKLNSR